MKNILTTAALLLAFVASIHAGNMQIMGRVLISTDRNFHPGEPIKAVVTFQQYACPNQNCGTVNAVNVKVAGQHFHDNLGAVAWTQAYYIVGNSPLLASLFDPINNYIVVTTDPVHGFGIYGRMTAVPVVHP